MATTKKHRLRFLLAMIAGLAMAYVLGVGPLVWLNESGYLTVPAARRIFPVFSPVFQLRDQLPELPRSAFDWYLNFWKGIADDPIPEFGLFAGAFAILLIVRLINRRYRTVNHHALSSDAPPVRK